jgi:hypothetical protein
MLMHRAHLDRRQNIIDERNVLFAELAAIH